MQPTIITKINGIPIYHREIPSLPANKTLTSRSRTMRKAGVLSEVIFWLQVHKGKFHKIDFDRQRIIGNYIVDFYVKALGLVIEIDGASHNEKQDYDARRDAFLTSLGLTIHRIPDTRIKHDLPNVLSELESLILTTFSSPPPEGCPQGGVDNSSGGVPAGRGG